MTVTATAAGPSVGAGPSATVERLARVAVAVAALVPIGLYLYVALRRIGYPFELEWLEGGAVEIVNRVLHGQAIYGPPSAHFVAYPYPPLYFWLSAAVAKVIGIGFVPLRLVSLLASLGSFAVLFEIVRGETRDPVAGLVAAGLFAATYDITNAWFDIGRVDSLFVFFLLAAVAVARRAGGVRDGALVGLLVFLSFFTKQTALLAATPMLVYLVVVRWRVGVAALGSLAALVALSTVVLDAATHGWYGYFVFVELARQGVNHKAVGSFVPVSLLRPTGWAIGLGAVGAAVGWRRRSAVRWPLWAAVAVGMIGASWVSLVHQGGTSDVLIPAYAAVALVAGLGYDALRRAAGPWRGVAAVLLAALVVVQIVHVSRQPLHEIPTAQSAAAGRHFIALVASLPGAVIVNDHPWYDTMAGKASWAQSEAVHDVLRGGPSVARTDLLESIARAVASPSVSTVFADEPGNPLGPGFWRYFRVGPPVFHCFRCFFPVTDVPRRPYLRYVRRTDPPPTRS